jgi:hypothetical protein
MRIGQKYIGKVAEVTWRDPYSAHITKDAPRGRATLATWTEYGVIDDVTEGVVRIVHSIGQDSSLIRDKPELHVSGIPEVLIERIRVFEPVSDEKEG